jgi:hypothetical protein
VWKSSINSAKTEGKVTRVGYCVVCGEEVLISDEFPSRLPLMVSKSGKLIPVGICGRCSLSGRNMGMTAVLSSLLNGKEDKWGK